LREISRVDGKSTPGGLALFIGAHDIERLPGRIAETTERERALIRGDDQIPPAMFRRVQRNLIAAPVVPASCSI